MSAAEPMSASAAMPRAEDLIPVGRSVRVRVPASSGNVGPGYDSLGLALGLYDDVRVTRISQGLEFSLEGEGTEQVPRGPEHLILRAMAAAWEAAGVAWGEPGPGLRLETVNRIPHSRGLGSSASAIVAGVCAADALLPDQLRLGQEQILQVCSRLEGHPDNVAPSLYGGLVVSWEEDGVFSSARIPADPRVTPVAAVPDYEVPTKVARGLIPAQVPHGQAAMTAGRAALLVHAVGQAPELLFPATRDGLHQQYRASALAPSAALLERLRAEGFPAIISGAGPTVLVLAESPERARDAQEAVRAASEDPQQRIEGRPVRWRTQTLAVDASGVMIETEDDERPVHTDASRVPPKASS